MFKFEGIKMIFYKVKESKVAFYKVWVDCSNIQKCKGQIYQQKKLLWPKSKIKKFEAKV